MSLRIAARYVSRRLSSSGKVLSEEEKAAENIYIKKAEKEKLEKLAHKNAKPEEKPAGISGGSESVSDAKASSQSSTSTGGYRNYGVIAGVITVFGGLGWYLKSKKPQEVQG